MYPILPQIGECFGKNKTGEPKANPKPLKTIKPPDIMAVVCDRIAEIKEGISDEN